ncbi:glycosyltransferase family 61 protein [Pontimonas sp.]|nr:glycosyltransferase family 61 protein [Pontimonas sp.]
MTGLLRVLGFQLLELRKLPVDKSSQSGLIGEFYPAVSMQPEVGDFAIPDLRHQVWVGEAMMKHAVIVNSPRLSGVAVGRYFFLHPGSSPGPWKVVTSWPPLGGLVWASGEEILLRIPWRTRKLDRATYVGSLSPHNWYHWTIDTLPGVFLSEQNLALKENYPLLLPEVDEQKSHWREILALLRDGGETVTMRPGETLRIKELRWVCGPSVGVPTPRASKSAGITLHVPKIFREYGDFLIHASGAQETRVRNRVFMVRNQAGLRPYNQEQILDIAKRYGFDPVVSEQQSLTDLMAIFASAEFVIGPHGAGWANILFCRKARGALLWTWDQETSSNWFQNLCFSFDIPVITMTTGPGNHSNEYHLSPQDFESNLRNLLVKSVGDSLPEM